MLTDVIPPKARKYVYAVVALLALVYGAWQANDGNWGAAMASLLASVVNALAHGNTNPDKPQEPER